MKKITLNVLTFLFILVAFQAKSQDEGTYYLEAKAGFNSVWIANQNAYGNMEMPYGTTFGLTGGLGFSYFGEDWGFSTTPVFAQMGQIYSGEQNGGDAERKVKLNYLQVPLMAMYSIRYQQNPTWVAFGPELSFLLSAKQEYMRTGGYPLPKPDNLVIGITDVKDRFKTVDLGMAFAVNKLYEMRSNDRFMLLLSFNTGIGLLDINSKDWQIPNAKGEYDPSRNFYLGLKAGLLFKVGEN